MSGLCYLHSLWIGRLTWLEQLCLTSWCAQGHKVILWTYGRLDGVPEGVEVRDGREILSEAAIAFHRVSGSVSLFSNRFRYHLFQRYNATWLDTDVILLDPLVNASPYLFAWESPDSICSAVLRLPSSSPVLFDLLALADAGVPVPHWWPLKNRLRQRLLGLVRRHEAPEDMDWGTFGPRALTETLSHHHLSSRALPKETFYPLAWTEAALFYADAKIVEARLSAQTVAVHLWSTSSRLAVPGMLERRLAAAPVSSWIGEKCKAYGINPNHGLSDCSA